MEKRLTADLNVVANSDLEIQLLDGDLNIIQKLDDEPNDVGGLTSAELKAKFDESGNIIKKYINETLIPAVLTNNATEESRKQAEAARVAAEQTRQSNEETRQANEAARISAENARNVWENYDASKAYVVGNKTAYGGSSYLCIKPCTGIAPPSAEYWLLIAKKGDKGEPGGGGGQHTVEIDLSDKVTLSSENLFASSASIGNEKSIGEKIKQAVLAGRANVTVTLKIGEQNPEIVTLPMFGTKGTLKDGTPTYSLTGTYVWAGLLPMDIMIGAALYENDCTVVKRIESVSSKPLYDPVNKPDETPDGAFLRWNSEQKKWVAEKSPVVIDLYSEGVDVDLTQPGTSLLFDVPAAIVAQFVAAAKNGGALLKFGVQYIQRFPGQAYFVGAAVESMEAYQLSGKMFFVSSGVNIFFSVELSNSNSRIKSVCTFDQSALPDPETADDGAFLRVESGKWVASNVPSAEGGTF
jgi:hypothetical protein